MTALIPDPGDVVHVEHPVWADETTTPYHAWFADGTDRWYSRAELIDPLFPEVEEL